MAQVAELGDRPAELLGQVVLKLKVGIGLKPQVRRFCPLPPRVRR